MGSNRKEYFLTDLYSVSSGLSKPAKDFGEGYPFVAFKDVMYNFFLPEELSQLVRSTDKERQKCSVKRGDVFLTRTSETMEDLGMSSVARRDYPDATFNGFTKRLRPHPDSPAHPEYVAYFLRTRQFRNEMMAFSTMSTRASLNNDMIGRLKISLPPLSEQRTAAHILRTLDDKIELNRRMNETLEGMAQALFKSWFVDFDPVIDNALAAGNPIPAELADRAEVRRAALADGTANREAAKPFPAAFQQTEELGWIPEDWEVGPILNQAKLLSGGTPKTSEDTYWNGDIKWASAKDVSQCGKAFLIETERTITQEGLDNSSTKIIPRFSTVIVSRGATTGRMTMFGDDIAMNQTCYALRVNSGHHFYGYCHAVHFITSLVQTAHGSVFDTITTKTFQSSNVVLASESTSEAFESSAKSLFEKILTNQLQSQALTKLRDTLLPKLISGELRIPDAEKLTEEALA